MRCCKVSKIQQMLSVSFYRLPSTTGGSHVIAGENAQERRAMKIMTGAFACSIRGSTRTPSPRLRGRGRSRAAGGSPQAKRLSAFYTGEAYAHLGHAALKRGMWARAQECFTRACRPSALRRPALPSGCGSPQTLADRKSPWTRLRTRWKSIPIRQSAFSRRA